MNQPRSYFFAHCDFKASFVLSPNPKNQTFGFCFPFRERQKMSIRGHICKLVCLCVWTAFGFWYTCVHHRVFACGPRNEFCCIWLREFYGGRAIAFGSVELNCMQINGSTHSTARPCHINTHHILKASGFKNFWFPSVWRRNAETWRKSKEKIFCGSKTSKTIPIHGFFP